MAESKAEEKEKPSELKKVAEETGELLGKGIRKAWSATKSFGKGLANGVEKKEEPKDTMSPACPHCGTSLPPNSNFCPSCGKKT